MSIEAGCPARKAKEFAMSSSRRRPLFSGVVITTALAFSAISIYDAVYRGVVGHDSPLNDKGPTWITIGTGALAAITFAALAATLAGAGPSVDAGSRVRSWLRRLLMIDFAILAAVFAVGIPFSDTEQEGLPAAVLGGVGTVTFVAMFLFAFSLGIGLLRVRERWVCAILLIATVPLIGLAFLLHALGTGFEHPAYAETAVYLGIALLARRQPNSVQSQRRATGVTGRSAITG
jgi:hypothetical protein